MTFFRPNFAVRQAGVEVIPLHKHIYKIENFFDENEIKMYTNFCNINTEEQWRDEHWNHEPGDIEGQFWYNRQSKYIMPFEPVHSRIFSTFAPDFVPVSAYRTFNRLLPGETTDVETCIGANGRNHHYNYMSRYRLGIYVGEFTGGEVAFPEFDLVIPVKSNDLLVWPTNYYHYVMPVTSGVRYSYSDYLTTPTDAFFA